MTPSTYFWTALGDGQTWNDPSNWYLAGSSPLINQPTVPTPYSNVVFPPLATLPAGASTTINFNFAYLYMPLNSLTIEDSYTFTGNPIKIDSSLSVTNPFTSAANGADCDLHAGRAPARTRRRDQYRNRQHAPARAAPAIRPAFSSRFSAR